MLTGPELGAAIKIAMQKKRVTQKQVADEFGIQQPSVSEWTRHGRLAKEHITHLVSFFGDVVGPEHWGLPRTWGGGSVGAALSSDFISLGRAANHFGRQLQHLSPTRREKIANSVATILRNGPSDEEGADIDALAPQFDQPAAVAAQEAPTTPEPNFKASTAIDRAFREAFYSIADEIKTKHGSALFNDLRDGIEHLVAEKLRLDLNQAREALHAGQSDKG